MQPSSESRSDPIKVDRPTRPSFTSLTITSKSVDRVEDGRLIERGGLQISKLIPVWVGAGVVALGLQQHLMSTDEIPMPGQEMAHVMDVVALIDVGVVQFVPKVLGPCNPRVGGDS